MKISSYMILAISLALKERFLRQRLEISIRASEIILLAKSIRPLPIVKEKDGVTYDSFVDIEQRFRNRHLDLLLNPQVKKTFILRTKIIQSLRENF